jgi:hypothetical protein
MTQATYTVPGNPADPAGGAREVSQEFTAMLQARVLRGPVVSNSLVSRQAVALSSRAEVAT